MFWRTRPPSRPRPSEVPTDDRQQPGGGQIEPRLLDHRLEPLPEAWPLRLVPRHIGRERAEVLEQQRLLGPGPGPLAELLVHPLADPRPIAEVDIRHDRVEARAGRDHGGEGQESGEEGRIHGRALRNCWDRKNEDIEPTPGRGYWSPLQLGEGALKRSESAARTSRPAGGCPRPPASPCTGAGCPKRRSSPGPPGCRRLRSA